jgi:hypothetical protein
LVTVKITVGAKPAGAGQMEVYPPQYQGMPIRLKLEGGATAHPGGMGTSSDGTSTTYQMSFQMVQAKVLAVEYVADTVYHTDSFDFELKDIPLPK